MGRRREGEDSSSFFFAPSNKEEKKRIFFPLGEENEEKESPSCSKFLLFSDSECIFHARRLLFRYALSVRRAIHRPPTSVSPQMRLARSESRKKTTRAPLLNANMWRNRRFPRPPHLRSKRRERERKREIRTGGFFVCAPGPILHSLFLSSSISPRL